MAHTNEDIISLCDRITAFCIGLNERMDAADRQAYMEWQLPTHNQYVVAHLWQQDRTSFYQPDWYRPPPDPDPPYAPPAYANRADHSLDWQHLRPPDAAPYFHNQPPSESLSTYQPPPSPPNTCQQHTYKQPTYLLDTEPYGQSLCPTYTDSYRQLKSQPYTNPWQQDQLVYRPPPPTEGPSPPPQHQPCWSSTSHCRTAAPLPAVAVVQPLKLPQPAESSPPCSPATSAFGSPPRCIVYLRIVVQFTSRISSLAATKLPVATASTD